MSTLTSPTKGQAMRLGTVIDVQQAASLEDVLRKAAEQIEVQAERGYFPVSVSHACDVSGSDEPWSVLVLFRELDPNDLDPDLIPD